jgi:ubiquinone biosynthesis protein COQ9
MLPYVPVLGWGEAALRRGLRDAGGVPWLAPTLFSGGAIGLVEAASDLADRRLVAALRQRDLGDVGMRERLRAAAACWLGLLQPHREAVRRAVALLMLPGAMGSAVRILSHTADSFWFAIGDRSADFSWYGKRATLGAMLFALLLFWLQDTSEDAAASLAFFDRELAAHARLGRLRRLLPPLPGGG